MSSDKNLNPDTRISQALHRLGPVNDGGLPVGLASGRTLLRGRMSPRSDFLI